MDSGGDSVSSDEPEDVKVYRMRHRSTRLPRQGSATCAPDDERSDRILQEYKIKTIRDEEKKYDP